MQPQPLPTGVPGPGVSYAARASALASRPVPAWAKWLAIVALVVAAASAGRFSAPLQTETLETVRVVTKDRIVERAARVETRIVYRDRTIAPDGTRHETEIERSGSAEVAAREEKHEAAREVVREVKVTVRPDWRVALQAGASLREPLLPIAGPLVLGAEVDRRIVGGVSAGVWASTSGAAGLSLSVEF